MKLDATGAQCSVFAFKEGLLSAVGHDVCLSVGQFEIEIEEGSVVATFRADSLRVLHAMQSGRPAPSALSGADKRTIEGYVREDILHSRRYPTITFRSRNVEAEEDEAWRVEGDLTLHGRTRPLAAQVTVDGASLVTRVVVRQPDFGITPFRAMLGTLRIQPQVEVELRVPRAAW